MKFLSKLIRLNALRLSLLAVFFSQAARAQHERHMPSNDTSMSSMQNMNMNMDMSSSSSASSGPPMTHAFSLNLPMGRNGSGTSWLPDASPMYGSMVHSGKWMYMIHGSVFLRYTDQDFPRKGARGGEKVDGPNWFMLMAQIQVGKHGLFTYDVMISLDRITEGGSGYPLLFQTGESWNGLPLVDRQHPHDLFSGLSVGYTQALSKKADLTFYFGYPGEPALGSPAFMHRPSAMEDPDAPISHHWDDGTHITFGVATLGLRYGQFKLEGSSFTGREPDENRYDFDPVKFDSWSARLSFNPGLHWSMQVSHGWIKSPEALMPDENVHRSTASVIASFPFERDRFLNASLVWGQNKIDGVEGSNAVLAEGSFRIRRTALYTRYEWVQKSAEELNLSPNIYGTTTVYPVGALTLGGSHDLWQGGRVNLAVGGQILFYHAPGTFDQQYGGNPLGAEIYLHLYPSSMMGH